MKRRDLAGLVANEHGVTKIQANEILHTILDAIVEAAEAGNKVAISGFGHFHVKERPARNARNPRTGKTKAIKARRALVFRPAKAVRDELNPA